MIGSHSESSCIQTVFISKHVTDHKFLEDVDEDSLQIPRQKRQKNRFLCNCPNEPLKASGRSVMSRSFSIEAVRTSLWRRPDAPQCLKASALKTSGHQSKLFRIFRTSVRMRKRVIAKIVRMHGQAVRTYTCYGKICAILEGGLIRPSGRS